MKISISIILLLVGFTVTAQDLYTTSDRTRNLDESSEVALAEMMLNDVVTADNIASYKIEYELIDYDFTSGDSTILELLDTQGIYSVRKLNEDQILMDIGNGVTIQLYSYKKALVRRKGLIEAEPIKN